MTERWPRVPGLIAVGIVAAIIIAAVADHSVTYDSLPEIDSFATASQEDRSEREDALDGFEIRAWLYSGGIVAAIAALLTVSLRRTAPEKRADLFRDLGVAGVLFLFAGFYVMSREPYLLSDSSSEGVYVLPGMAMLAGAGIGGLVTRSRGQAEERDRSIPPIAIWALGLTGLTVALTFIGHIPRECDGQAGPGWSDTVLWLAILASLAAAGCGIVALFQRRWIAALVSIPAPLVAVVSILAAACLS